MLQCRDCRGYGDAMPLDHASGVLPLLPRCACSIRMHRGKLPAAVTTLLNGAPNLDAHLLWLEQTPHASNTRPSSTAASLPDGAALGLRKIYSVDNLPTERELMVYRSSGGDRGFQGKIVITAEHKLSDVVELMREHLDVKGVRNMYRAIAGQDMKVPLHRQQYDRSALTFFPLEHHVVLVDADP